MAHPKHTMVQIKIMKAYAGVNLSERNSYVKSVSIIGVEL